MKLSLNSSWFTFLVKWLPRSMNAIIWALPTSFLKYFCAVRQVNNTIAECRPAWITLRYFKAF